MKKYEVTLFILGVPFIEETTEKSADYGRNPR